MLTKSKARVIASIMLLVVSALTGCGTTQMATGNSWDDTKQVYPVKSRQDATDARTLGFGPYRSSAVRANATKDGHHWEIIPVRNNTTTSRKPHELSFRMTGDWGSAALVYCVNRMPFRRFASQEHQPQYYDLMRPLIADTYQGEIFATEIVQEGNEANWKMMIASNIILSKNQRVAGYLLNDADNYYAILPVFLRDNSSVGAKSWKLSGYRFKNRADQLVAEISLHNKTSVTLGHLASSEKFLLANACAAILINHFSQLH